MENDEINKELEIANDKLKAIKITQKELNTEKLNIINNIKILNRRLKYKYCSISNYSLIKLIEITNPSIDNNISLIENINNIKINFLTNIEDTIISIYGNLNSNFKKFIYTVNGFKVYISIKNYNIINIEIVKDDD